MCKPSLKRRTVAILSISGMILTLAIVLFLLPIRPVTVVVLNQRVTTDSQDRHIETTSIQECYLVESDFTLAWIHSVDRTPWFEEYHRDENNASMLILRSTQFKNYGAGTPDSGEIIPLNDLSNHSLNNTFHKKRPHQNHQQIKDATSNHLIHYTINRPIPIIHWIVSRNVESTILTNQFEWKIYKEVDDYSEITIYPKKITLWHIFIKEPCYADFFSNAH